MKSRFSVIVKMIIVKMVLLPATTYGYETRSIAKPIQQNLFQRGLNAIICGAVNAHWYVLNQQIRKEPAHQNLLQRGLNVIICRVVKAPWHITNRQLREELKLTYLKKLYINEDITH